MKRDFNGIAFLLVLVVLLAGCTAGPATTTPPAETNTLTSIPSLTHTASPTSTDTLTASPTRSPSPTASPSPTDTPSPTATLSRSERSEFTVTVVRVVDGDTVEIRYSNGDIEDIRLLGVDTPEVHTAVDPPEWEGIPDTSAGRDHLRNWGEKASSFASNRLEVGEEIRLVVDAEADRRGAYGRLLVYVYDDGALFNLLLIEQGYARFYESSFSKSAQFEDAETSARNSDVGVWDFEASTPTPTETDAQSVGDLAVVEIHEDAEGNDHENENDEYIVFENTGDSTVDLTGWTVEDEADHTYTFPSGFTLDPGDRVTLYTGSGSDTATELYWGSDSAIWNNGGDTIYVYDDSGDTVIERSYS